MPAEAIATLKVLFGALTHLKTEIGKLDVEIARKSKENEVPREHSTGGKQRLGAKSQMGERTLRRLLIIGANSVIIKRHVHAATRPGTWLGGMLTGIPPKANRKLQRDYDSHAYKWRHLIGNYFAKIKEFRGIATR